MKLSVPEHVDGLLLRLLVRSQEGGAGYRPDVGRDVGGIQSWRSDVLGPGAADDRHRRLPLRRDRLPGGQIHELR